jgi:16S rRNA (adenine1518-N6/adenine1519-N6)-dimethyltransferase
MIAEYVSDWPAFAASLGILETVRAEELSLLQWIDLVNKLRPFDSSTAQNVHEEMFDVVDEHNKVIGVQSRHEVHTQKLRHRAVHIFVFNKRGELFLQKRSRWKDKQPRKWDSSAAGHLNAGDDYDPTAARELTEEIGIEAPVELAGKIDACPGTGWEFVHLYIARHEGPFVLARSEIESGAFFPMPLIRKWAATRPQDFAKGFLECLSIFDDALIPVSR